VFERITFALADVVLSTNESYARVARERGGVPAERVFVVRSAPDASVFRPRLPVERLKYGKSHLLAYLGVMGPQDGVDHALRALALLKNERQDWHATFIGSGDVFDEMVALRDSLGLGEDVDFTGRVPVAEVLDILSTADVGLAPDPLNPLNDVSTMNKILEYMAMELPVVSYDLREARISAGASALYARVNEISHYASQISQLLDSGDRRSTMGRDARTWLVDELSWPLSVEALLAACGSLGRQARRTARTRMRPSISR